MISYLVNQAKPKGLIVHFVIFLKKIVFNSSYLHIFLFFFFLVLENRKPLWGKQNTLTKYSVLYQNIF